MTNKLVKQTGAAVGWTDGGISVYSRATGLFASFTLVAGSEGIVAGLAPAGTTPSLAGVQHGFKAADGAFIEVIEGGVVKATSDVLFTADTPVRIYRVGTAVYYGVGNWEYASLVASSGTKKLLAALYAPGDAVDVPKLASYAASIDNASFTNTLEFSDSYFYDPEVYAGLTEVLTFSSVIDGNTFIDAGLMEFLTALDGISPQMTVVTMLENLLTISDTASANSQQLLQYATNLVTGAVGRYNGFDFLGFCRVGMDTYGYKADGLYKVETGDDDGLPISALIDFAGEGLAGTQHSRVTALFFGLSTDGQVFARLTDDRDREVTYHVKRRDIEYRTNPFQGISSRFWRLRLEIVDATDALLDNVEWVAGSTNRRTTK